ncbi:L-arabinolactonase [compost metagenome]
MPKDACDPDGMTVDADGMLWIAEWNGGRVAQWDPNTGEMLNEIKVPSGHVTSCVFGGRDLQDLYITTACVGMNPEDLEAQPLSGNLFRVRTEVKGQPTYSFTQSMK